MLAAEETTLHDSLQRDRNRDVDRLKFKGKNRHYLEPHSKVGISN